MGARDKYEAKKRKTKRETREKRQSFMQFFGVGGACDSIDAEKIEKGSLGRATLHAPLPTRAEVCIEKEVGPRCVRQLGPRSVQKKKKAASSARPCCGRFQQKERQENKKTDAARNRYRRHTSFFIFAREPRRHRPHAKEKRKSEGKYNREEKQAQGKKRMVTRGRGKRSRRPRW